MANIVKTSREAMDTLAPKNVLIGGSAECGQLGVVYRKNSLLKDPLSGECQQSFEISLVAGVNQTLFDPLNWYDINTGNPAAAGGGRYTFLSSFYASGNFIERLPAIQRMVLQETRLATIDGAAFTGSVEVVRVDQVGSNSSDPLDFNQAINPKSQFNWLYEFRDMRVILDQFTTIRIVTGAEDIKLSFKFSLSEVSFLMRQL